MEGTADIKDTPLLREHLALKAKMVPFAGWNMPVQYEGIIAEHLHTRTQAALFDICHMGEFYVKGDALKSGLERLFSFSIVAMPHGKCRYGAMMNEEGGIIDDLIVYRIADDEWMVVVNASTIEKDAAHIRRHLSKDAVFEDLSPKLAKLDLQGPLSRDIIADVIGPEVKKLKYYTFGYFDILGEKNIISRTGYTGELGYELYISVGKVSELWNRILADRRVKPAGLGARDTLRLEMGYTLYGQDVDETTTPLESNLVRFIHFDRDFIGREALLKQKKEGIKRFLVPFRSESRRAPRHEFAILAEDRRVGTVTSGSFAPSLSCGIGLGYIEAQHTKAGQKIFIEGNSVRFEAVITERPFYKQGTARL